MEIKVVKEFITAFIESEYDCNRNEYISSVTDEEFDVLKSRALTFYHSIESRNLFIRGIAAENLQYFTAEQIKAFEKKSLDAVPRTLFQIKHYQNPTLGDVLKRIVVGNDLYACYVSYTEDTGSPLDYARIFYIANTDEGLKIIYYIRYNLRTFKWEHAHDLEAAQVLASGQLIEVEKYHAPEEKTSLEDYNS